MKVPPQVVCTVWSTDTIQRNSPGCFSKSISISANPTWTYSLYCKLPSHWETSVQHTMLKSWHHTAIILWESHNGWLGKLSHCACPEIKLCQDHWVHQDHVLLGTPRLGYTETTNAQPFPETKTSRWTISDFCVLLLSPGAHRIAYTPTPKLHFQEQKSPKSGTQYNFQEHISKYIPTFMK